MGEKRDARAPGEPLGFEIDGSALGAKCRPQSFETCPKDRHEEEEGQNTPIDRLDDILVRKINVVGIPRRRILPAPMKRLRGADEPPFVPMLDCRIDNVGAMPPATPSKPTDAIKYPPHRSVHSDLKHQHDDQ